MIQKSICDTTIFLF